MGRIKHLLLIGSHLALAAVVVLSIDAHRRQRLAEVEQVRLEALAEQQALSARQAELRAREHLRDGLRNEDPYAIELILRERLGYTGGPDEIRPPPLPSSP